MIEPNFGARNKTSTSPRGVRIVVMIVFALGVCGILFLSWKDIYSEIPRFDQLQRARANEFRANIAREVSNPLEYSIEFFDPSGKRYQTSGIDKAAFDQITAALSTNAPVFIRYGRWRAAFPSATIVTVYQLEIGDRVVIPYEKLATARQREQAAGPLIILFTALAAGFAIWVALRRQKKFEQRLALLKSRNVEGIKKS